MPDFTPTAECPIATSYIYTTQHIGSVSRFHRQRGQHIPLLPPPRRPLDSNSSLISTMSKVDTRLSNKNTAQGPFLPGGQLTQSNLSGWSLLDGESPCTIWLLYIQDEMDKQREEQTFNSPVPAVSSFALLWEAGDWHRFYLSKNEMTGSAVSFRYLLASSALACCAYIFIRCLFRNLKWLPQQQERRSKV